MLALAGVSTVRHIPLPTWWKTAPGNPPRIQLPSWGTSLKPTYFISSPLGFQMNNQRGEKGSSTRVCISGDVKCIIEWQWNKPEAHGVPTGHPRIPELWWTAVVWFYIQQPLYAPRGGDGVGQDGGKGSLLATCKSLMLKSLLDRAYRKKGWVVLSRHQVVAQGRAMCVHFSHNCHEKEKWFTPSIAFWSDTVGRWEKLPTAHSPNPALLTQTKFLYCHPHAFKNPWLISIDNEISLKATRFWIQ